MIARLCVCLSWLATNSGGTAPAARRQLGESPAHPQPLWGFRKRHFKSFQSSPFNSLSSQVNTVSLLNRDASFADRLLIFWWPWLDETCVPPHSMIQLYTIVNSIFHCPIYDDDGHKHLSALEHSPLSQWSFISMGDENDKCESGQHWPSALCKVWSHQYSRHGGKLPSLSPWLPLHNARLHSQHTLQSTIVVHID